mmetsp:Transcript_4001/g.14153  ORF Transcript_4001/g.14153 Transcript_4001/m.14153 type:complete len:125 (-) Transcript_4001:453-827(-)
MSSSLCLCKVFVSNVALEKVGWSISPLWFNSLHLRLWHWTLSEGHATTLSPFAAGLMFLVHGGNGYLPSLILSLHDCMGPRCVCAHPLPLEFGSYALNRPLRQMRDQVSFVALFALSDRLHCIA